MVTRTYFANVDACVPFAEGMSVSELCDDGDRVEPCVLGKRGWDDFEGIGVRLETVSLHAFQRLRIL